MSTDYHSSVEHRMSLDDRLEHGPLQVKTLWDDTSTAALPRKTLERRRRQFVLKSLAGGSLAIAAGFAAWFSLAGQVDGSHSAGNTALFEPGQSAPQESSEVVQLSDLPKLDDTELNTNQSLRLSDGSSIVGGALSHLRVTQDAPHSVVVIQEEGVASFFVVMEQRRSFQVQAGDVTVATSGAEFEVNRSSELTQVSVKKGNANVRHQGRELSLSAGQSHSFSVTTTVKGQVPPAGKKASQKIAVDWRRLAEQADYEAAYAEIQQNPQLVKNTSADLMLAADVARWSRHPGEAAQLLARVSSQFPADPLASLAAFTRGRVLVENLGQPATAAAAFALSRRLSPSGSLAADALIREIDARASVGQQNQVRALASEYLSSYPQGRHRAKCEKLVTPD